MTKVVVCGIAGELPLAGVALHYLQYCLGLRDMGIEVMYLEDNMGIPYDPVANQPDHLSVHTKTWLTEMFERFELPWAYADAYGQYIGMTEPEVHDWCATCDLLLNVSGGSPIYEHHRKAPVKALVDTDPGFWQALAAQSDAQTLELLSAHDLLFTFAENVGNPTFRVPDTGHKWIPTRQPVYLPFWEGPDDVGDRYTTVMNWRAYESVEFEGEMWGQKDAEFQAVRHLPKLTGLPLELALGGGDDVPRDELSAEGWIVVDPYEVTKNVWIFRDYIRGSRGEFTVAKGAYVRSRSGWFSERSANYLASGRAVVAQDTGWSEFVPSGDGLYAWSTPDEAVEALRTVEADPNSAGRAARRVAREHFDSKKVLERLLSDAGIS